VTGERIQLVVQGDDFGMCHAVNEGVARAFEDGILTQSSTMVACPWFYEAAHIGNELSIPLGIHQTLTCEWDYLRWPPITGGSSLVGDDRTFHRTVDAAQNGVEVDDAIEELSAQAERFLGAGLDITYFDVHMGLISMPAYLEVSKRYGVPFLYPGLETSLTFTSIRSLSDREEADKKAWLLAHLEKLIPGVHLLVCHPGSPGAELSSITGPDSSPWRWAEEYRATDLAVLTDSEVADAVARLGIELVSVSTAEFAA
jgi:predicted glycoside hydrolase/deacetylase ChbG (UPF0249 family)